MAYERVNWQDYPSKATPLNAENLNKMDEGIANLDAESESLKAFGNEGKLVYVHDGALDTLEPSNLDLHVGSPTVVTEAAQMTDSSKIYVYNGEETGYTAGDWYSYDGEQWVDRGPFNEPEIVTDKELTVSDRPADGKVVGDRLETKANIDGAYDAMTVGSANQLISTVFVQDNAPYTFRTAGGYADIGDRMQDSIIGGSVVWNQLRNDSYNSKTADGITTSYSDGQFSITNDSRTTNFSSGSTHNTVVSENKIISGHKYLVAGNSTKNITGVCLVFAPSDMTPRTINSIFLATENNLAMYLRITSAYDFVTTHPVGDVTNFTLNVIDLTQMFGSDIADYICSLEQAHAGDGVAFFRKMFPKSYYEYNAGEIKSLTGLAAHETTGFNQWDEEWELGRIDTSTGENASAPGIRSKNFIPVVPSATYYIEAPQYLYVIAYDADKNYLRYDSYYKDENFTSGADVHYIRFYLVDISTYNHDICINLHWDGERDGEYEEYVKHSYPLDSSLTLRGMLKLDEDGQLYYDGDKYESDGTVTRKYGIVDLGTLTWGISVNGNYFQATFTLTPETQDVGGIANVRCPMYRRATSGISLYSGNEDKVFLVNSRYISSSKNVYVRDTSYSDATTFKAAMDGVMLVYELATPTTEQAAPFAANQVIDDFGTEAYTFTDGAFEMPVGHESKYTNNLRAKLEMAPNSPSGDGKYLVKQENGLNEYVPYVEHDPTKANIDGNYEAMTVGNAEQLVATVTVNDQVPYTFRTAGGSADIGDRLTESIVGGSVVWNQLCYDPNLTDAQNWKTYNTEYARINSITNNIAEIEILQIAPVDQPHFAMFQEIDVNRTKVPIGHVCLFGAYVYTSVASKLIITNSNGGYGYAVAELPANTWTALYAINVSQREMTYMGLYPTPSTASVGQIIKCKKFMSIDLTQMFGSDIADHIHVLEQANPGDGVAWFKRLFPNDYYEYNPGELKSISGLAAHETVGFNAWDEEWEVGTINTNTGEKSINVSHFRSKNYIPVFGGAQYYAESSGDTIFVCQYDEKYDYLGYVQKGLITLHARARYILFVDISRNAYDASEHPICINLHWDGERDGEYEPYIKRTYPLDSSLTLRGIPKLNESDNSLYFDGDRYNPDGTVERRYGIVDLGTLNWWQGSVSDTRCVYSYSGDKLADIKQLSSANMVPNLITSKFVAVSVNKTWEPGDISMGSTNFSGISCIVGPSEYDSAATFKAAMDGVYLVYELATPTIEEAEPFQSPQVVDDFGTEAYTFTEGSFVMPVGHDSKYQPNLRAKLEMAPNSPDEDGTYLLTHYNGQNSYIPYVAPRGIPMTNPSEDGEYELILTMSNGTPTLEWVSIYNPNQS